jgi:hypothetical protein
MHGQQNVKFCNTLRLWLHIFYLRMVQSRDPAATMNNERNITIIMTLKYTIQNYMLVSL